MLIREFLAEFFVRGLPVVGAAAGGILGARRSVRWWEPLAWTAAGWTAGWGASRAIQWSIDRMVPGLPDATAEIGEGASGYDPSAAALGQGQVSGIRYVNLDEEKARARAEAVEKRRARRGKRVEAPTVTSAAPSTAIVKVSSGEKQVSNEAPSNVVPLAVRRGMVYGGLRVGKNVLGVSRPKSPGETGA